MPNEGIRYPVLLEPIEYDGVVEYSATVPDLPGCVAAGDSPEEAMSQVQEAIRGWLAIASQEGLTIPEPRRHSGRFTVRVPSWLHAELDLLADLENVSLNQYVSAVLAEHVGQRGRPSSGTWLWGILNRSETGFRAMGFGNVNGPSFGIVGRTPLPPFPQGESEESSLVSVTGKPRSFTFLSQRGG